MSGRMEVASDDQEAQRRADHRQAARGREAHRPRGMTVDAMNTLASKHPRWGYRSITKLLKDDGLGGQREADRAPLAPRGSPPATDAPAGSGGLPLVTHDRGGSSAHALKRQFQQRGCCRCVSGHESTGAADRLSRERLATRRSTASVAANLPFRLTFEDADLVPEHHELDVLVRRGSSG
jgi:hypothetical protein